MILFAFTQAIFPAATVNLARGGQVEVDTLQVGLGAGTWEGEG